MGCEDCSCRVIPDSAPVSPSGRGSIALVVDAPSSAESLGRTIFNGPAGEVLAATIRAVVKATGHQPGELLDEVEVFHAVARPTPGGKPPSLASIRACHGRLVSDLVEANPRMILSVGAAACASLAGVGGKIVATPITKWRGQMRWLDLPGTGGVPWIATISPGSVLGKNDYYRDLVADVYKAFTQVEPLETPAVVRLSIEDVRAAG